MDTTKEAVHAFNMQASLYNERFTGYDLYNETYDILCGLLKQNAVILELACGPGNITRYLLAKRPDLHITATDLAPEMLKLAMENNPNVNVQLMDCRDIGRITEKYDAIICGFGIPYLNKEECLQLIGDAAERLNVGGILYFSLIEDSYNKSGYAVSSNGQYRTFVHYYEEEDTRIWLSQAHLEPLHFIRKTYNVPGKEPSVHLIVLAGKGKTGS